MSTGKRLAKRSIIGTRVCAPGNDGKYYSGVIHAVKTPASAATEIGLSITPKTRYSVRFDPVPGGRPPSPSTEYSDQDLIGPGFGSVTSARLVAGQKVYLTYNGREIHAEVTQHRKHLDEVDVLIAPTGQEGTMSLTKRIDEVRLLESRKSARLADQDTDFARLADMAGDRKRASSHSIDVPHVPGSRKRRPSSSNDSERSYSGGGGGGGSGIGGGGGSGGGGSGGNGIGGGTGWSETPRVPHGCGREGCRTNERGDCMDECTAALVLMSLSCSPHSPHHPLPLHCQHNYGSWDGRGAGSVVVGSPGVGGTSNSSSSSSGASWRSGTPSPPLSEEGAPSAGSMWPTPAHHHHHHPSHNQLPCPYTASGSSSGSTPGSTGTLDEGIVPDYLEDMHPRKKKSRARVNRDLVENGSCSGYNFENCDRANPAMVFKCTWPGCGQKKPTCALIEEHVRQLHLGPKKTKEVDNGEDCDMSDHEEEFYYQEEPMSSPPTMSHRDMARPPHEDPEYQKQLRLEAAPIASINNNNSNNNNNLNSSSSSSNNNNNISSNNNINSSNHSNSNNCVDSVQLPGTRIPDNCSRIFAFGVTTSPQQQQQQQSTPVKHIKLSPRQLQVCQQNVGLLTVTTGKIPSSPRKVRGETKKCRKIYGMDHRELWCTQCKWKKACSRFGE